MRQYQGTVFFVDILGIGVLTRGHVSLIRKDYELYGIKSPKNKNTHYFSAKLLIKFRKILNTLKNNENIEVAQLSDCAFIWSEKSIALIDTAISCMWKLTKAGLLCRGGIAYGNIVEPDRVNTRLGKFLLGEAATKAVDLEKSGKGCRIFSDPELPAEISGEICFMDYLFIKNKNPNDCSITDELRWYLFPDGIDEYDFNKVNKSASLIKLMRVVSLLWYSPMFRWNASNKAGEVHVASSIETLSSGSAIFTQNINLKFSSETLIGHLGKNRTNKYRASKMKAWRKAISEEFKTNPTRRSTRTRKKTCTG